MSEKVSDDYGSLKPFLFLTKALLIASMVCAIGFIVAFIIFITNVSSYVDEVAMIGLYLSIGFFAIGMSAIALYAICKDVWQNRFVTTMLLTVLSVDLKQVFLLSCCVLPRLRKVFQN